MQRKVISSEKPFPAHYRSSSDQFSKTLPRNYNNSVLVLGSAITSPSTQSTQNIGGRPAGVLDYFDLDHSNPPPICNNASTSASTSNLSAHVGHSLAGTSTPNNITHRFSTLDISTPSVFGGHTLMNKNDSATNSLNSSTNPTDDGQPNIVYKLVDFIKTEAFNRTRQDAELARAKNRSKD